MIRQPMSRTSLFDYSEQQAKFDAETQRSTTGSTLPNSRLRNSNELRSSFC